MTMDCKQCAEDLTAFLDGELSRTDSEQVQSHLRTCESCSEESESLRESAAFIELYSRNLDPRPESWNLVRARIHERAVVPAHRFPTFNRFRWALAAMAFIAVLALGYTQYQLIQRKNLDRYISQYVRERPSLLIQSLASENPYQGNPFMEIQSTITENPFRSEDR
jgi:anti-sigma factor RsiW